MDPEERARRQSFRVIISEIIMVITVIITVVILALLASGYWLNADFEVQRQGMLQIHSVPTGANIAIDGDILWMQRTNTSKVLASGKHHVILTKDGYDSWERDISISEGLLYRVNYPRLFLLSREKTPYYDADDFTTALVSPNHNYLLLGNNTTEYAVLRLNSDKPEVTEFDLLALKSTDQNTEKSSGSAAKSTAELFAETPPTLEWDESNNLIAVLDEKQFKINWHNSEISAITEKEKPEEESELPGKVFHFYDEKFGAVLKDNTIELYKKGSQGPEVALAAELTFTPEVLKIRGSGGFIFMQSGINIAILDMEIMDVIEWQLDSNHYGWLDNNMLYAIKDGTLVVYDFDGQNRRELSEGLDDDFPVTITDDKWLYYFSDGKIVREIIAQ